MKIEKSSILILKTPDSHIIQISFAFIQLFKKDSVSIMHQ